MAIDYSPLPFMGGSARTIAVSESTRAGSSLTRHGRACSTCVTCSTAAHSWNPSTTIAFPVFVGRLRGMCSQRSEAGTRKGTDNPT